MQGVKGEAGIKGIVGPFGARGPVGQKVKFNTLDTQMALSFSFPPSTPYCILLTEQDALTLVYNFA